MKGRNRDSIISLVSLVVALPIGLIGVTPAAIGQTYGWHPWAGMPGVSGGVNALTVYNGQLIAGGQFSTAGGVTCNRIAAWNGSSWQALGSGMGGSGRGGCPVSALTVYNGQLIAGGWFTSAGGVACKYIAAWNGSSWQPLGTGMDDGVCALAVYNGQLIAGGWFTSAGGVACNGIAAWGGTSWQPLGGGMHGYVNALTVYNGQLIAGGQFSTAGGVTGNGIAAWNGSSWQPLGSGVGGSGYHGVSALTVYNGQLIAGGDFTTAGGNSCYKIAVWNGFSWQALGSGMGGSVSQDMYVQSLAVFDGRLIAGGQFDTANRVTCNSIAAWNGSSWQALGSGMDGGTNGPIVNALTVYNGHLIAGGDFWTAGGDNYACIAVWKDSSWQDLSSEMNGSVDALTVYNEQLIVGGYFTAAGGNICKHIARWDGTSWHPLGSGVGDGGYWGTTVEALTAYNGQLVAGGCFTTTGGNACKYIAVWNGSSWQPLGSGMNHYVKALTVYNGQLIAGGQFSTAGGVTCNCIAAWNGSSWQPLGSGTNGCVNALMVYNGQLIAGGQFTTAGGVTCNAIAAWNGSSWQPLGSGIGGGGGYFGSFVNALTVYNGQLVAGGCFSAAGGNSIAAWNGSSWQALGSGMDGGTNGPIVNALTVYNGQLVASGDFTTVGGVTCNYIARWDGTSWQPLASGMNSVGSALVVHNGQLVASGGFSMAEGQDSAYLARWGPSLTVLQQPMSQSVPPGGTVVLSVSASGSGTLTYQWRKDGVNLTNGGRISGATTSTLTIGNAGPTDVGSYDVVVTDAVGTVTTVAAQLMVAGSAVPGNPALTIHEAVAATSMTLSFAVTLSEAATEDVTVHYATSDGTALQGKDYETTSGILTLPAGHKSNVISVPILTGATAGATFSMTLSNPTNATIETAEATATIPGSANPRPGPTPGPWCGSGVGVGNLIGFYGLCWAGLTGMGLRRRVSRRRGFRQ